MLTRRSILAVSGGALACAAVSRLLPPGLFVGPALAQSAQSAASFVQDTGNRLIGIVNGPGSLSEKRARLQQAIDASVDVNGIAQFCLGRFWRTATPEQQRDYLGLFHDVLLNNIAGRLGEYKGVTFELGRAQERPDGVHVSSVVHRPNNPPANVDWVIGDIGGGPRIVDVVAEGTSLRQTQRSDYASYMASRGNNVQALIDAMRHQVSQNS